jgi:pimeloyl-ACP methyl ester carboxylesterase
MPSRRNALTAGLAAAAALPGGVTLAQTPATPAPAAALPVLPYKAHSIRTPDGLTLAAYEYGNPNGPAILFIHGYAQAALCWDRQVLDPALAREFRMVALDLRGHGMSDKPVGNEHYRTSKLWADDVKATIDQLQLVRPTLVGWSYGGRVMGDYLMAYGTGAIGAMDWVSATSSTAVATRFGRAARHLSAMGSPDPATSIASTIAFLRDCFEVQPSANDFEVMLSFNMMVPRHVRVGLGGRPIAFEERLRTVDVPVLVTHGVLDKVSDITMGRHTASLIPGARLSEYNFIGHAPFWEDAPRFNRELAELVRSARR